MAISESTQKKTFEQGEGDNWFERNLGLDIGLRQKNDPIIQELARLNVEFDQCLEIGCADGWRLDFINKQYSCSCFGIDPSEKAVRAGSNIYPNINLIEGTADNLPYENTSMDIVILGFCLYLCDRKDLFKIAYEVDRVLSEDGLLVILDFYSEIPYKNKYGHLSSIYSYKMDYSKLFTSNPIYQIVSFFTSSHSHEKVVKKKDERISLHVLRKSISDSYSITPEFRYE